MVCRLGHFDFSFTSGSEIFNWIDFLFYVEENSIHFAYLLETIVHFDWNIYVNDRNQNNDSNNVSLLKLCAVQFL